MTSTSSPSSFFQFIGLDTIHIGHVTKIPQPETQHRKPVVHAADRYDAHTLDLERIRIDGMQVDFRNAGIFGFGERVTELPADAFLHVLFGIDVHRLSGRVVEGPHIVYSRDVILVVVSEQDSVQFPHAFAEHLLPEIGAAVDEQTDSVPLDQHGGTQTFVAGIRRSAGIAVAGNHRHALRSPGAQKSERSHDRFGIKRLKGTKKNTGPGRFSYPVK